MSDARDAASPPLVSVVLGAYNAERDIRRALACVFAQTFRDFEVIVVDDASTDGTPEILAEYGSRIRVIRRASNSRTCELPRYEGTAAARGRYAAFLDADDLWTRDKLEKQVAFMEAHPDVPLSHTYARIIDDGGRPQHVRHEGIIPPTGNCARPLLEHCFITISTVLVRPRVWLDALPASAIVHFGMDQDFFLAIARRYPIGFIPEVLGSYRRSSRSVSQAKWWRRPRNVVTLERLYRGRMWEGIVSRGEMRRILVEAYEENADAHRDWGHPWHSLHFCWRGWRWQPWRAGLYVRAAKALGKGVGHVRHRGHR